MIKSSSLESTVNCASKIQNSTHEHVVPRVGQRTVALLTELAEVRNDGCFATHSRQCLQAPVSWPASSACGSLSLNS